MKKLYTLILILANITAFAQIKTYSINQTLIGPSAITLDIDSNSTDDFTFDILTLSPGTYAARVLPVGLTSILDNSTFGYADALNFGDPVTGYFNTGTGILGTIAGAGQFNGMGIKYLGFKINLAGMDHYGWFKLKCSINRDTLEIISIGYNTIATAPISAGQTSSVSVNDENFSSFHSIHLYPNPASNQVTVNTDFEMNEARINLYNTYGQLVKSLSQLKGNNITLSLEHMESGIYSICYIDRNNFSFSEKIIIQK